MATRPIYPQDSFIDKDSGRPNRVWQLYFTSIQDNLQEIQTQVTATQNQVNSLFANTLPSSALPATPDGYIVLTVAGKKVKVPFYNI